MRRNHTIRLLALVCAVALLFSLSPVALAYGDASGWAKEELDQAQELGLIPRELEEKDSLKVPITRLEMCMVAVEAYELYQNAPIVPENDTPFADTDSPVAAKAHAIGVAQGYEDGTFRPERNLTRQEFFCIVHRFLLATDWEPTTADYGDLNGFEDEARLADWAREATRIMVGTGVVRGTGTALEPAATTTCEQALMMFLRAWLLLPEQEEPTEPEPTEPEPTEPEPSDPEPADPVEPPAGFEEKYPGMDNWAKPELVAMELEKLIPGILTGRNMKSPVTRREVCHVAVNAFRVLLPEFPFEENLDNPFTDVEDDLVTQAYYLGIISGYPDGTFCPEDAITREQFFKITVNFLSAAGYYRTDDSSVDLSDFEDGHLVQEYARGPARLLCGMGVVKGDESGCLRPRDTTQCQQALAMFYRAYLQYEAWLDSQGGGDNPGDRALAEELVAFAMQFEGYPYVWAGKDPETGFDCSGLVYYVYRHFGFMVGRTATDQWYYENSWEVERDKLLPGDLLFFSPTNSEDNISHVGIYIGNDQFIHAANSSRGVVVDSIYTDYYENYWLGARRLIP